MYLRLTLVFLLFFAWGPGAMAQNNVPNNPPANPPDEITLEANVVQIVLNDEHRGGVDWGAIVSDFHTVPLKKENDPVWNDPKHRLSFGTISQDDYAVLLDALDMAGQMSQFPQSPIKVTSGTAASISFEKQNIHVDFLLSRLKSGDLSLRIDPHIAVPATEIWNGENIPASVLLQAQTKVLVTNDMTIVIGGLMKEEQVTRKHKFPLLGNIPLVGLVFRSKGRLMQKTETVIFLTVRTNAVEAPEDDSSS
jgi:type II secretory pathway component GspD/PulD (secretin)